VDEARGNVQLLAVCLMHHGVEELVASECPSCVRYFGRNVVFTQAV